MVGNCSAIGWFGDDFSGTPCLGNSQGYGPFDYTDPGQRGKSLELVESAHFTPAVRRLVKGKSATISADLDYTIRAYPNHHQALASMVEYYFSPTEPTPLKSKPECYLQRALVFRPNDAAVHHIFAIYAHRRKMYEKAIQHYDKAIVIDGSSGSLRYNRGLTHYAMKQYDEAFNDAMAARERGYPLQGLMRKLVKHGYTTTAAPGADG